MACWGRGWLLALVLAAGLCWSGEPKLRAADQPPLSMQNLVALAGAGLGDKDIADQVARRGVNFDVTPDVTAQLRKAGLGDEAIQAVTAAAAGAKKSPATPAGGPPALSLDQIKSLKAAGLTDDDIAAQIDKRGVNFTFNDAALTELVKAGFGTAVIKAVQRKSGGGATGSGATPSKPVPKPRNDDEGLVPGDGDTPAPQPKPKAPKHEDPLPMPSPAPGPKDDPLPMPSAHAPGGDDPLPMPKAQGGGDDDPLPMPSAHAPEAKPGPKIPPPVQKKLTPLEQIQKTTEPDENIDYGPRAPAEAQKRIADLFTNIAAGSPLKLTSAQSQHITLIASQDNVNAYLPIIKSLETKLAQKFPGIVGKGIDKRSAIIVLTDSRMDYKTWIMAEYHAMGMDQAPAAGVGQQAGGGNPLTMALNSSGSFLQFCSVEDLSSYGTEQDRQTSVCYSVGYLYIHALSEGHAPDAIMTGFANYCEELMYNNPMTRVISYEERKLQEGQPKPDSWGSQVKAAVQQRTCLKANDVLNLSTVTMKPLEYAEAWSLTSYLCQKPKEFENLVTALRDKNGATLAIDAFYRLKDEQLNYQWQLYANVQN